MSARVVAITALWIVCNTAWAQPTEPDAYTPRDPQLDTLLREADAAWRRGDAEQAVVHYLELERALDALREEAADVHPVTEVGPRVEQSLLRVLRERLRALPDAAQDRFRQSVEPRASSALRSAGYDLAALERVAARYPTTAAAQRALTRVCAEAIERGELDRAQRALRARCDALSAPLSADARRAVAQTALRLAEWTADPVAGTWAAKVWSESGGDPEALQQRLARLVDAARGPLEGFDPGPRVNAIALETPDLPRALEAGLAAPACTLTPVVGEGGTVYVADAKSVRAVALRDSTRGWTFHLNDAGAQPSRVEALPWRPALGPGLVLATLDRNRPAEVELAPGDAPPDVRPLRDWRVVALDAAAGTLVWDAAALPAFEDVARGASWVSSPLWAHGSVFVTVVFRDKDLRVELIQLDGRSGAVQERTFVVSRASYDPLGVSAPPPPPVLSPLGDVVVSTGAGVVAAVDPGRGDVRWIARYPRVPQGSALALVRSGRRFAAVSPLGGRDPVVAAPVDGAELVACDATSGAPVWRHPRGAARFVAAAPDGDVVLVGQRLEVLDRNTGRVLVRGPRWEDPAIAPPLILGPDVLVVTARGLVRVRRADGTTLACLPFDDPLEEAGTPVWLERGAVATAGSRQLNVYASLPEWTRWVRGRESADGAAGTLGRLLARRGDRAEAWPLLVQAARSERLARAEREAAQVELLRAARARAERQGWRSARPSVEEALRVAAGVRLDAPSALGAPVTLGGQEVVAQAAALLADYAGWCAEHAEVQKAVHGYQALLTAPPASLVALRSGLRVDARVFASQRVRALVEAHGEQVYAEYAQRAQEALRLARDSLEPGRLQEVARLYPACPVAAEARWARIAALLNQNLQAQASEALREFVRAHPGDPRVPQAYALSVPCALDQGRPDQAREALRQVLAVRPEPQVGGWGQPARRASVWAEPYRQALVEGRDPRFLFASDQLRGLGPRVEVAFATPTERSREANPLTHGARPWGAPEGVFLVQRSGDLEVWSAALGRAILRVEGLAGDRVGARAPGFVREVLVVPFVDRVEGYRLTPRGGERIWRRPIEPGGSHGLGPEAVHGLALGRARAFVLTGGGAIEAIDPETGASLWRQSPDARCALGLRARHGAVLGLQSTPKRVVAWDGATGRELWRSPADARTLSVTEWVGATRLGCVEGANTLAVHDTETGAALWRVGPFPHWISELFAAPGGRVVVARCQEPDGRKSLRVHHLQGGRELWSDLGQGAIRPGVDPSSEPRGTIGEIVVGDGALYTVRTVRGGVEVWAQDLESGQRRWRWAAPRGGLAIRAVVEGPEAVYVLREDSLAFRVTLTALRRGTGEVSETRVLVGRRLVGVGVVARSGCLVVSTDRGVFGLRTPDHAALAREVAATVTAFERAEGEAKGWARERLAAALRRSGRLDEARALLVEGLEAEGALRDPSGFDALFAELSALEEAQADASRLALRVGYMTRPPEIDGELSDRWRPWDAVDLRSPRFVQEIQAEQGAPGRWLGPEDLSARLYLGWDADYFYLALDVEDAHLRLYDGEAERWIGDCLLIAIDPLFDGGQMARRDDVVLTLALVQPKQEDDPDAENQDGEEGEDEEEASTGRYSVRSKDDRSGVIYEAAVSWDVFREKGVPIPEGGPDPGFRFGFNAILTDDDGDLYEGEDPARQGPRGALKTLELTPSVLLHERRDRLWQGCFPDRFAEIELR